MSPETPDQSATGLRRDQILSAVGIASSVLLKSASWKDALGPALERLGQAAAANRAYFFENETLPDGQIVTSQVAEWAAEGIEPQIDNAELQNFPFVAAGLGRWLDLLTQRKPVHGLISNFPEAERAILESQGIQSLVAMPVFANDKLVGFLGFDDCVSLREWSAPEFDALFAAATALGAAIERQELEQQLRFAQKMEAVGVLASGVAHDFNNMLQAIVSFTSVAKFKLADDDSVQEILDEILAASNRAHSLTRQLLSFSRKEDSRPRDIDLREICESVVTMLKPTLGTTIELAVDIADPAPIIFADASLFSQVLLNLCLNACDAMPEGGQLRIQINSGYVGRNAIEPYSGVNEGDFAVISVIDDGCGMTESVQDRIFEPFFTTKEVGRGTGLGLTVAYATIHQGGGFLEVFSNPGEGTRINVCMPVSKQPRQESSTNKTAACGSELLLLVDDEPMVLSSTQKLLQAAGYRVLTATNGKEALQIYQDHIQDIELVITDSVMPIMDGTTLIQSILGLNANARAILTSGDPASASALQEMPNVVLLQKPVTNQRLHETIRQQLLSQ